MKDILRATFKTGSGSLISLVSGVVTSKIMAVILGPAGIGLYSMLSQIQQTATTIGSVGGGAAIVQGIASREKEERDRYLVTTFWIFIFSTGLVSISVILFAPWIAHFTIGQTDDASIGLIRWLALAIALSTISLFFSSLLNGFRAIGRLALVSIGAALTTLALSYPISILVGSGFLAAFVIMFTASAAVGLLMSIWFAWRSGWLKVLKIKLSAIKIHGDSARAFFAIGGTTFITGLVGTLTILVVRSLIVQSGGLFEAGVFNVAWTIGMMYPMIFFSSFGTYYFPTLSQRKDEQSRTELMTKIFRITIIFIVPIITVGILVLPLIVSIFYSTEFNAAIGTLKWMFLGDYFRATSWVLAMPLIAYANMRVFFITEILWNLGFLGFSFPAASGLAPLEIIGFGFFVTYLFYLIFVKFYSGAKYHFRIQKKPAMAWWLGLALVGGAFAASWWISEVNWTLVGIMMIVSVVFVWIILDSNERQYIKRYLRL